MARVFSLVHLAVYSVCALLRAYKCKYSFMNKGVQNNPKRISDRPRWCHACLPYDQSSDYYRENLNSPTEVSKLVIFCTLSTPSCPHVYSISVPQLRMPKKPTSRETDMRRVLRRRSHLALHNNIRWAREELARVSSKKYKALCIGYDRCWHTRRGQWFAFLLSALHRRASAKASAFFFTISTTSHTLIPAAL